MVALLPLILNLSRNVIKVGLSPTTTPQLLSHYTPPNQTTPNHPPSKPHLINHDSVEYILCLCMSAYTDVPTGAFGSRNWYVL